MSRAERFTLLGALMLVLVQALAAAFAPVGAALEYQLGALAAQPWRLFTAHWVHINWPHALINAAAWLVVVRLFARELTARRQIALLVAASVAIGGGLAAIYPQIAWYRGFSGVLHALFFAGAATWLGTVMAVRTARTVTNPWLPAALLAGGWAKVLLEQPAGDTTPYAVWLGAATVPQAHLLGGFCGTAMGVFFLLFRGLTIAGERAR